MIPDASHPLFMTVRLAEIFRCVPSSVAWHVFEKPEINKQMGNKQFQTDLNRKNVCRLQVGAGVQL